LSLNIRIDLLHVLVIVLVLALSVIDPLLLFERLVLDFEP